MAKVRYTAVYERDLLEPDARRRHWLVRIEELQGCQTDGRTIEAARRHIREALDAFLEDGSGKTATIVDRIEIGDLQQAMTRTLTERDLADQAVEKAQAATREIVRQLDRAGISQRDSAALLGISFQRIGMISRSTPARTRRVAPRTRRAK